MIMTNEEYSEFSRNLFDKFEAGEMTAEEVYAELNKVEGVVFSGPRRRNLPEKTIEEIEEIKREFNIKWIDMDNELSEPIYENYDEDLQAFNGTGVILTSEEIKELFNCKGEWEVTDGVTDMSF